jgi:uncharacterized OsmC-like protein
VGEVHLEGKVLVVKKISVVYTLSGVSEEQKETVERVHSRHAEWCPVARSISPQIEIETHLEYP